MAGSLPAHVMVGEPVQFRMHQREQLFQRFLVSVAPLAEQLGDRLSRGSGRRHTGSSTPQILTRSKDFYSRAGGALKKNCAIGGGSQAVSPLTHMNRHKQQKRRKNQNRNQTLERKNPCELNNQ